MDDIFERVHAQVGCPFLSDLPNYPSTVYRYLLQIEPEELSQYPRRQLEDFSTYVFSVPYDVLREALAKRAPLPLPKKERSEW